MQFVRRVTRIAVLAVATTAFFGAGSTSAQATDQNPLPADFATDGSYGKQWQATQRTPIYPNVATEYSVPIKMSDGATLRGNVYRPADWLGNPIQNKTPVVVDMNPYSKLVWDFVSRVLAVPYLSDAFLDFASNFDLLQKTQFSGTGDMVQGLSAGFLRAALADFQLVRGGYTVVLVDVRGTGISDGKWLTFANREQQDYVEVIDWASKQPWSDGKVGTAGVSYSGINQLQVASKRPPALKASFATVPSADLFQDVVAPGGGLGIGFMPPWLGLVNLAKWVPIGLKSQEDLAGWFKSRAEDPFTFGETILDATFNPSIDDLLDSTREVVNSTSAIRKSWLTDVSTIQTPTFIVGGWHDLFVNSQTRIYNNLKLPNEQKKLVMGNGYHLNPAFGAGRAGRVPALDVLQRAWFDHYLKGIDNGIEKLPQITMDSQGQGWVVSDKFPRDGVSYTRAYLSAQKSGSSKNSVYDGSLANSADTTESDLSVKPGLWTICSRDSAQETIGVVALVDQCGKDSRIAEQDALTFSSKPVSVPTTISGAINVHLNVRHEATDGYWAVSVNDVAPDGTSTLLGSGQITSSLRKLDPAKTTKLPDGDIIDPYPLINLADREKVVPGKDVTIDVGVAATDAVLQPGHRLRVSVWAANFPRGILVGPLRKDADFKPEHIVLNPNAPSFVKVPLSAPLP